MGSRSAVIVQVRLPAALERIRAAHDPVAAAGVPAHVTILFPFVPVADLSPDVRQRLAAVVATTPAFDMTLARTGRFPGSLWLAPEPSDPFRDLTERVTRAFPAYPPYEGVHDAVIPHLTLAVAPEAALDALEGQVRARMPHPPRPVPVRRVVVIAEGTGQRWAARWRLPLRP